MPIANYLECGSELKVKIELAYPLNASEDEVKDIERERQAVPVVSVSSLY